MNQGPSSGSQTKVFHLKDLPPDLAAQLRHAFEAAGQTPENFVIELELVALPIANALLRIPENKFEVYNGPDLSGEWIGSYPGHPDQTIKITQTGRKILAVKVTGDDHVPGGQWTFSADLDTGFGEGQVAYEEFREAGSVPGQLLLVTPEKIIFYWEGVSFAEFRRDD